MLIWILFIAMILGFLALDLGVFNKNPHIISNKETAMWTGIWVTVGLSFSFVVYYLYNNSMLPNSQNLTPGTAMVKYITGYLVELSLSVDNIFVIAVIFTSFRVPQKYQHRVLFWGIMGALVFRALMIFFGVLLIEKFTWTAYVFGGFLIYTALKMLFSKDDHQSEAEYNPKKTMVFRIVKKIMPVSTMMDGEKFIVRKKHLLVATPLLLVLIIIELTDILFALDSIPAILAITTDPFIVFTSNIFAILGLRSMYFFLSNMLGRFNHLKYSLVAILTFVGIKLILKDHYHFPEWVSLGFIGVSLLTGITSSLLQKKDVGQAG
ncbi:MAG: TerC family protein [Saprospiraceae bacterium]|nr:TerC family protein [Saprospiraceae bacterium]